VMVVRASPTSTPSAAPIVRAALGLRAEPPIHPASSAQVLIESPTIAASDLAFATALKEEPKLRQAFIARYGSDIGEQAVAAAMAWAWEHKDRLAGVTAMRAYLFRVGQSSLRRSWVWASRNSATFPPEVANGNTTSIEDALDLGDLLRKLPQKQRTCVLLIYAHGWPYRDVAELLDISVDAVNNHTHRGMTTLRKLTKNTTLEDQSWT
jgi:RNA polymerase sigma factor (sigma-70 family)